MSLYREPRRRTRWLALALGLVLAVGFLAGYLAGRAGGDSEPSLTAALARLQRQARPAADALELVAIEYPQAVRDGRVIAESEYKAAQGDLERARTTLARLRPELELISPAQAQSAAKELARLAALVESRSPPPEVEASAQRAKRALERAARLR